jgi:hypothetical protein
VIVANGAALELRDELRAVDTIVANAAAHGSAIEPINDLRTRPSDGIPVMMTATSAQPGMTPFTASVSIDNELPDELNWDAQVAAMADILAGLTLGVHGVMAPRSTAWHFNGYRAGLASANAHRIDES